MTSGQSGQRQASRHLANVLHSMLVKSRASQARAAYIKRGKNQGHDENMFANGDPREEALWGEGM